MATVKRRILDDQTFKEQSDTTNRMLASIAKAVAGGVATLGQDGVLSEEQRPFVDAVPTKGSSSPVQSGGVYSALSNKVPLYRTFAELGDVKNHISHRARAVQKLVDFLKNGGIKQRKTFCRNSK